MFDFEAKIAAEASLREGIPVELTLIELAMMCDWLADRMETEIRSFGSHRVAHIRGMWVISRMHGMADDARAADAAEREQEKPA